MKDKTDTTDRDPSSMDISMIEVLVTSLEGVIDKKENLSFVDFNFIEENDRLDADDESPDESCIYCNQEGHG